MLNVARIGVTIQTKRVRMFSSRAFSEITASTAVAELYQRITVSFRRA